MSETNLNDSPIKEIWKDIEGYEGYYEVSNLGNVRRTKYYDKASLAHHTAMKNMRMSRNHGGYLMLKLTKQGFEKMHYIHRLVANAFVQNPNNLNVVNHIDGDKNHNYPENLEWVTTKENNDHAYANNLRIMKNKKGSKSVYQFNLDGKLKTEYPSAAEASRKTGFARSHIVDCCNGKCRTWKGYVWRWKENSPSKEVFMREHGNKGKTKKKII